MWIKVEGGIRRGRRKGKTGDSTQTIKQLHAQIEELCRDDGVPDTHAEAVDVKEAVVSKISEIQPHQITKHAVQHSGMRPARHGRPARESHASISVASIARETFVQSRVPVPDPQTVGVDNDVSGTYAHIMHSHTSTHSHVPHI
jgi:hypothetical protein